MYQQEKSHFWMQFFLHLFIWSMCITDSLLLSLMAERFVIFEIFMSQINTGFCQGGSIEFFKWPAMLLFYFVYLEWLSIGVSRYIQI